jgi:hypothetical protein
MKLDVSTWSDERLCHEVAAWQNEAGPKELPAKWAPRTIGIRAAHGIGLLAGAC